MTQTREHKPRFDYRPRYYKTEEMLEDLIARSRYESVGGTVASYIPELAKVSGDHVGVALCLLDGTMLKAGDAETRFSIQSISKTLTLLYALIKRGEDYVFSRIGKEPTGDPFNSGLRLESSAGGGPKKPMNPFINAGAIVSTSLFPGTTADYRFKKFLAFVQDLLQDPGIELDEKVYQSEKKEGHRNRALSYLMRESNILTGEAEDIEANLDVYFRCCSLTVTCNNLARFAAILAALGWDPVRDRQVIPPEFAVKIMVLMSSCGLYDDSGTFAFNVGIPAKSGVGGGILGAVPNKLGMASWAPPLDPRGNSVKGQYLFDQIAGREGLSIFGNVFDRKTRDAERQFQKELQQLLHDALENLFADEGFIGFNDHQGYLDLRVSVGAYWYMPSDEGFAGLVYAQGLGTEAQIADPDALSKPTGGTLYGELAAPIQVEGKTVGIILLDRVEGEGKRNSESILPQNFDVRDKKRIALWAKRAGELLEEYQVKLD